MGCPNRLRPGTSPHALRIPPRDGHPALRSTASGGSTSVLAVSSFRLRARLDVSIPSPFSGQRGYEPASWIGRPSFERPRDFNPPEQRTAQRTLPGFRRFGHPPRRPISLQCQLGNLHCQDFHLLDHQPSFTALSRRTKISISLTTTGQPAKAFSSEEYFTLYWKRIGIREAGACVLTSFRGLHGRAN